MATTPQQLRDFFAALDETEVRRRKPLWGSISALWLDNDVMQYDVDAIVLAIQKSGYSDDELTMIYRYDVAPAVFRNLLTTLGQWDYFSRDWLFDDIL